jgi:cytochrome c peroxidase
MGSLLHAGVARPALAAAVAALAAAAGCADLDKLACNNGGNCGWSDVEVSRLEALADLPAAPPPDPTNRHAADPAAAALGRQLFWDARFSGVATGTDAIGRPVPFGRAAAGQPLNIACVTCHDLHRAGVDAEPVPGNVSLGASWTATNAGTVFNEGFQPLPGWSGRHDSLWAQAAELAETVMGSNRLRVGWTLASFYRAAHDAVFTDDPLPMAGTTADLSPALDPATGQCKQAPGCPASCRAVTDDASGATGCWPRFPLDGRPGSKPGCQPGDAAEPFGDAFDCMDPADQTAATRALVDFGKAIAAFEMQLGSRNSAFDAFVADLRVGHGNDSEAISDEARRGARLFVGKAGCSDCHNTPLLSDGKFYDIYVPQVGPGVPTLADCPRGGACDCDTPANCLPFGVFDGNAKLRRSAFLRGSAFSDDPQDSSRQAYLTSDPESFPEGGYRTPSLRDVALTAPYMHDGAYATLEEVVAHYNRGGDADAVGEAAARIKPLYLTTSEQADLVEFLGKLTGEPLPSALADPPPLP